MSQDHDYLFKFIVSGDSSVGKTSLLRRFAENVYSSDMEATVGIDFKTKRIKIDGKNVLLMIWDTAGQEAFRAFTRTYYRGSAVAILVYDITKEESFKSVTSWLQEIRNNCENPNLGTVLVGNKSDLNSQRQVSTEEGQTFCEKNNLLFFETSAKSNENVEKIFVTAAEHFYQKFQEGKVDITSDSQGLTLGPKQLTKTGKCSYC